MEYFSTRQAAAKLGIGMTSLRRYIADGKVPAPKATMIGGSEMRAWSEKDIERVRALLPSLEDRRKTRHQKQRKKQTARKPKP
jgi:predicted DNA-binding transcriptional regulator AlpA